MTSRLVLFLVIVVLLVVGIGFLGSESEKRSEFAGEHSTFSAAPRGGRALMALCDRLGLGPERLMHDLETIPEQGTIVSVAPKSAQGGFLLWLFDPGAYTEEEVEGIQRWVAEGNTFVLIDDGDESLPRAFGLQSLQQRSEAQERLDASERSPWPPPVTPAVVGMRYLSSFSDVSELEVEERAPEVLLSAFGTSADGDDGEVRVPSGYTPLVRTVDGRTVGAEVSWGRGRFVLLSSTWLATNSGLRQKDNALFMVRLLSSSPGKLYFDEFHHGFAYQRSLSNYLKDSSLWIVVCQILLLIVLIAWRTSSRFGPPLPMFEQEQRGSGDYVRAMSLIYQRGGHDRHAVEVMLDDLDRQLVERYRLPGEHRGERLLEALAQQGEVEMAGRVQSARREAWMAIGDGRRRKRLVLGVTRRLAELIEQVRKR